MSDLNFGQMQAMQETLQAKYEAEWGALSPKAAREHLLWMMIEAGEAADVIKNNDWRIGANCLPLWFNLAKHVFV